MRVAIGIPSGDMIHTDFVMSLMGMILDKSNNGVVFRIINRQSCYIDSSRTQIVKEADGAEYVLFLDSDMTFPPNLFSRLLAHNKDIVGCNYIRRRPPYDCTSVGLDGKNIEPGRSGLESLMVIPTGLMLVKMEVFKTLEYPQFACIWKKDHTETIRHYGEDTMFCLRAKQKGIEVWCDHDLSKEVTHIGTFKYSLNHLEDDGK